MKRRLRRAFAVSAAWLFSLVLLSCAEHIVPKMTVNAAGARPAFENVPLSITPLDEGVTISRKKVTIAPKKEDCTYTLSGYFNGQIVVLTKNTTLKLSGAYLENTAGKAALRCEAKTEVSSASDTTSYIVSSGRSASKNAALQGKRSLVLGGSGTLYVRGGICHAVEADDVKIKGSGRFYLQGTRKGSALNCETLEVEREKTFEAYFLNSKNGIKADRTMRIASGSFYLYNNGTALKTDTSMNSKKHTHAITLSGGVFHTFANDVFYKTEDGAYRDSGAQIIEETN